MPPKKKGQFLPGEMKLAVEDVLKNKKVFAKLPKKIMLIEQLLLDTLKMPKEMVCKIQPSKSLFLLLKLVFFKPFSHVTLIFCAMTTTVKFSANFLF